MYEYPVKQLDEDFLKQRPKGLSRKKSLAFKKNQESRTKSAKNYISFAEEVWSENFQSEKTGL
jgi:hypothetical protein